MFNFKITFVAHGSEFTYGYADTLGEAIELDSKCADEGCNVRSIKEWNPLNGTWVPANY